MYTCIKFKWWFCHLSKKGQVNRFIESYICSQWNFPYFGLCLKLFINSKLRLAISLFQTKTVHNIWNDIILKVVIYKIFYTCKFKWWSCHLSKKGQVNKFIKSYICWKRHFLFLNCVSNCLSMPSEVSNIVVFGITN